MSFGYLTTDERVGADGVKELLEVDLFELTLTATPVNPDARVLDTSRSTPSGSALRGIGEGA